ncbi:MAG: hypothetical protein LBD73_06785 [Deferribacteraceae bacterium]|nr:hypothetical protein [Deferribacteraceae bacterium]
MRRWGLAACLTKWLTLETLMNTAMPGVILETYVVGETIHQSEERLRVVKFWKLMLSVEP